MDSIILKAKKREELGKKVSQLREQGLIPAVLYGHKIKNNNLTLTANDFTKVFQQAGTSTLIDLEVEGGKPVKVIVADIQRDPVKHDVIHADLHQIRMDEEITADVNLIFIGEAPAVKELGGVLLTNLEHVQVKCLPGDLPHDFEVNLEKLETINSHIAIKELDVPEKVNILNDPEDFIAVVKEVKAEEEPVVEEEAAEGEEGAEEEGEKKEGEEGKEGEGGKKPEGQKPTTEGSKEAGKGKEEKK